MSDMVHGHPKVNEGRISGPESASSLDTIRRKVGPQEAQRKPKGRHPHQRLTAVHVRSLKKAGRYADGHGLYLFVDPNGAKRWIWRGVIKGKRCDLGIGHRIRSDKDQALNCLCGCSIEDRHRITTISW